MIFYFYLFYLENMEKGPSFGYSVYSSLTTYVNRTLGIREVTPFPMVECAKSIVLPSNHFSY